LRGREQIARLTARLRSEHDEYESASQSWSPEAGEKKKELRKARADTLGEIEAALARLGEVERLLAIERLPFEQKLAQLEAFLDDPQDDGSAAPSPEGNRPPDAIPHALATSTDAHPELEPAPTPEPPPAVRESSRPASMQWVPEQPVSMEPVSVEPDSMDSAPMDPAPMDPAPMDASSMQPVSIPPLSMPPVSIRPGSMRPRSRRRMGYWPVRPVPSAMPRDARWKVLLVAGVIAIQGLALVVLSLATLRVARGTGGCSESEPSRAATSNSTATAVAMPSAPPPVTQPASSEIPGGMPVAVPAGEGAAAQTVRRAASPPRPPARAKPTALPIGAAAAPSASALARRPETRFEPDTL
jgi:hypothetical protein